MPSSESPVLLRFEGFELDLRTGELRRNGRLVKLQDLPVKLLALLASRAGELVRREEIEKALWGQDQFVDFEHGINTAMRKVREALGETPDQPRFIETMPRKGYRFIAAVERIGPQGASRIPASPTIEPGNRPAGISAAQVPPESASRQPPPAPQQTPPQATQQAGADASLATAEFLLPRERSRATFLLIQAGYLAIYCAALYKVESMEEVLTLVYRAPAAILIPLLLTLAMCGIAVRLYLLTTVGLRHPAAGRKYRKLFPALFLMDCIWALSPLLLVRKMGFGATLACAAALAYLPFAQRTLIRSSLPAPPAPPAGD